MHDPTDRPPAAAPAPPPEVAAGSVAPTGAPRVRAIVLNWNGEHLLPRVLTSLQRTEWPEGRLELVVVDNASTDGSLALLGRHFPDVTVIRSPSNAGFPSNNLALEPGAADYYALINSDVTVPPGWLEPLVAALEADPAVGAACPRIRFADRYATITLESPTFRPPGDDRELGVRVSGAWRGDEDLLDRTQLVDGGFWGWEPGPPPEHRFRWTRHRAELRVPLPEGAERAEGEVELQLAAEAAKDVVLRCGPHEVRAEVGEAARRVAVPLGGPAVDVVQNAGSRLVRGGYGGDRGFGQLDDGRWDEPADVFAWCGAGVLLRPAYLVDVGLFDRRFFMYYEDFDLSWRGQRLGWRYRYVPASTLRHEHAATSVEGSELFHFHVERNRLVMLTKCAPLPWVREAWAEHLRTTARMVRNDVVVPLRRRQRPRVGLARARVRAELGAARLTPHALRARRALAEREAVANHHLASWAELP